METFCTGEDLGFVRVVEGRHGALRGWGYEEILWYRG